VGHCFLLRFFSYSKQAASKRSIAAASCGGCLVAWLPCGPLAVPLQPGAANGKCMAAAAGA